MSFDAVTVQCSLSAEILHDPVLLCNADGVDVMAPCAFERSVLEHLFTR